MRRVKAQPEFTLIGGILRFPAMAREVRKQLGAEVNVPQGDMAQFACALGAAWLGRRRLRNMERREHAVP